jgi:imidazolonepropionase-like amidohydrolase
MALPLTLFRYLLLCAALLVGPLEAPAESLLIRDARIVPIAQPTLSRGSILIRDGIIVEVGPRVTAPPGTREFDGTGLTVYPGFIDLHSTLAQGERPAAVGAAPDLSAAKTHLSAVAGGVTPAFRVASIVKAEESELAAARAAGITLALSVPGEGAAPGRGALLFTAEDSAQALVVSEAASQHFRSSGGRGRYPGTVMGVLAAQRQVLLDSRRYGQLQAREPRPVPDPALEALLPVVAGQAPLFLAASQEREIRRALRLAEEFDLRLIIAGGAESLRVLPELLARQAPVLFGLGAVPLQPARDRPDPARTPAGLAAAGLPFALTSGGLTDYAEWLRRLRRVVAAGLSEEAAVRALTQSPAELLGVDDRFGSLRRGQIANLVITEGPLFSAGGKIRRVIVRGVSHEIAAPEAPAPPEVVPAPGPAARSPVPRGVNAPVLIRGATLLTITRGVIPDGSLLIREGKITAIGPSGTIPVPADARVIEARGKYVMPGIIDAHSHMAIEGGINEGTYSLTPEVRVLDVLNPRDITIYRGLAGGVTTAHLMHGSANVIGGQNATIKLKWGASAADLPVAEAPRTVKFALGENPKRSNSTIQAGTPRRYPATRMGVEHLLREAFTAAREYTAGWERYHAAVAGGQPDVPPRRDLRLEALADILAGRILVQAHSYRADEILMLLRLAEEFGFRIHTLHHALEAYKVAPEIARHGAGVSTFADHWAYKVEAYDAIPHNAALCGEAGIRVSINSDSNERVRRLYWEAAKCIKYGGMSENEALKTITLNPAWQLGLEHRLGSLDVGKDADLAIFSDHPFSARAVCEMTLVEGVVYFDRLEDLRRRGEPGYPAFDAEDALRIGAEDECLCDHD